MKLARLCRADLQAVLFDFDGTLVDSVPDLAASVDAARTHYGCASVGEARVRDWVGRGAWNLIQQAFADRPDLIEPAYAFFADHYATQCAVNPVPYPGVIEGLAQLAQNYKLAVVTNKPIKYAQTMLDAMGLQFDAVLGADSVPNRKPAPDMLLKACELMDVDPLNAVMVGDSSNDSDAAQAIGMPVALTRMGYNHGTAVDVAQPDLIYHYFSELIE